MTTFELHAAFESFVLLENKVVRRRRVVVIPPSISKFRTLRTLPALVKNEVENYF